MFFNVILEAVSLRLIINIIKTKEVISVSKIEGFSGPLIQNM